MTFYAISVATFPHFHTSLEFDHGRKVDFNATMAGQRIVPDDYLAKLVDVLSRYRLGFADLEALREAVVNALIHRDYTYPADIQIRLEEDRREVWSPGELPSPLTPEALYGPHSSVLRNPLIARAFYFAGVIERWGTGTTRIIRLCREQELPEPDFAHCQGGVRVTFLKDPYTPERLRQMGLNERQIRIIAVLRDVESASVSELHRRFSEGPGR